MRKGSFKSNSRIMMNGPAIKGNPLKISVILLVVSYIVGDFVFPKYHLMYFIQLIGVLGLIFSVGIFNDFQPIR